MKFLDLFAGIGGFRMGLESLGHECVGFCEIDKFARKSYKAIYDTKGEVELHDITQVTNEEWRKFRGTVDIICGGFPCQAFSIAGKRKGFLDETRGTLFFEIARAAKEIKPPLLFLENVKGLLSHDKGRTFRTILSTLAELGYDAEWQVLNSKNFGVPQNRERVFIIGHLRGRSERTIFPIRGESPTVDSCKPKRLGNGSKIAIPVLTPDRAKKRQNGRRFKTAGEPMFTLTSQDRHGIVIAGRLPSARQQSGRVYSSDGLAQTLSTMQGGDQEPKIAIKIKEATKQGYTIAEQGDSINFSVPNSKTRRGRVGKQVAQTLDTSCNQATLTKDMRIRKLTPRECWRLQGFPDWAFDKAQEVNSKTQLYKQAGNSVTVNVIKAIAQNLKV